MALDNYAADDEVLVALPDDKLHEQVTDLLGARRRRRQEAAHAIALSSQAEGGAEGLVKYVDKLIEALELPEAQTRWEVLTALGQVALIDADLVAEAYDGAEASLFDEDSAIVRLAAFRFLVRLGKDAPERSDQVWNLLDEAIQCYHGDPEYRAMLLALLEFAGGNLSEATRDALIARVGFDAENATGELRAMSAEIVGTAKAGA